MKCFQLPRYLDEPERFLLWTLDEALVMGLPLVLGLMLHKSGWGVVLGLMTLLLYQRLKNHSLGFFQLKGFVYWQLPLCVTPWRALPPSWLREVVG